MSSTKGTAQGPGVQERLGPEVALEKAAREWRETFDAMDVGIVVTDEAGQVVRVNRAAARAAEADFASLLHRPFDALSSQEPWPTAAQLRSAAQGEGRAASKRIRDEARGRSWHLTASPMTRGGGAGAWVIVTLRDATAETEAEPQLRRARQMEALGPLLAGMAHELRTPLFSISATLEAFASEFGVRPEQEEYAVLLQSQVQRLSRLMSDLLDYGKPPALALRPGGITEAIEGAVRACSGLAEQSGVSIAVELGEGLPPVRRDSGRLEQVFQNLIANAIQHSPAGAVVRVATGAISPPSGGVRFTVEDRGPGVPLPERRRIFEPFVSGRPGGTGLGLSIAQRIVDGHGGTVTAGGGPKGGAVFTVVLPKAGGAGPQEVPGPCP